MIKKWYINGEWREGTEYASLRAPYTGEVIAEIPQATKTDVEVAIQAAKRATGAMKELPAHKRATILGELIAQLKERHEELARTIALEAGKPLQAARGEVDRTIATYQFAQEEAKRIHGETIPLDAAMGGEGRVAYTTRQPIGVVAAITPFNFPANLVAHKVGPAIAAGNTIVLKPASQTPLSALLLAEMLDTTELPKGAFNVITGKGSVVGEELVKHRDVAGITFTGSPEVGIDLKQKAGLKRVTLELGANSAVIVDNTNITKEMVQRIVWGSYVNNGQVCVSVQRIYIHNDIYDMFKKMFTEEAGKLVVGDALDEQTDISALISTSDVKRIDRWVQTAVSGGANIVLGGNMHNERIYEPTILENVNAEMEVSCQEIFGPVVVFHRFDNFKDAISHVNTSKYGLQAGVFTNNLTHAMEAAKHLEVGGVMINDVPTFRLDHMPYGGIKESGFGREGIKYAIEEMTELKLITFKW
ncbi:aldehyde dehydrogenase family protein [Ectobacillus sp. JY-23]|uniref:aldehyde dehydrogenase family protein n=1 Tax=Ectobacillus sp. JY-23 TaxID=2933872 RepID=UPI001FF2682B|nr:aldehyde dehydrogenase family protein [Ectobacillus sp. JY-23]UOY93072.1 aldehyde dehydrogenase family protein [Ectobacillus sp. JY-23]